MFKRVLVLAAVAACISTSDAHCANSCSGAGTCLTNDICKCYANYGGADCSERKCPHNRDWFQPSDKHATKECSGVGRCDTSTGKCECEDGYTGTSCQRTACHDCGQNGKCVSNLLLDSSTDADRIYSCKCDPGYTGPKCDKRDCPYADDPLTTGQTHQVQTCTVSGTTLSGTFSLEFTDKYGETYKTWALEHTTVTALAVKEALQGLPNGVIPSVDVAMTTASTATGMVFTVTFNNGHNSGNQNLLVFDTSDKSAAGHHVVSNTAGTVSSAACTSADGSREQYLCANRGKCNSETGQCECHSGYHGAGCSFQTSYQ